MEKELEKHSEEEEEALSLSDLPDLDPTPTSTTIYDDDGDTTSGPAGADKQPPPELFEFFSDRTTSSSQSHRMCSTEDIFFCGKLLVPAVKNFDHQSCYHLSKSQLSNTASEHCECECNTRTRTRNNSQPSIPRSGDDDDVPPLRRRSGSLSELKSTTSSSNSTKAAPKLARNSRSLDYRKLHRSSSGSTQQPRVEFDLMKNTSAAKSADTDNNNSNCSGAGGGNANKNKAMAKSWSGGSSRWYTVMFGIGMVKLPPPPEMDLMKDIKSRQKVRRRNHHSRAVKGPHQWGLLIKALSCKDHANVAVAAAATSSRE